MDHGGHGGHGGHGDMPMPMCSMHMLWNTQIVDTCIVFQSWHISSNSGFIFSCLVIVALGIFYEYLRNFQKKLDRNIALSLAKGKSKLRGGSRSRSGRSTPDGDVEESGLLTGVMKSNVRLPGTPIPFTYRALRASVYGATVFLSFFLMLVFMTYNAYLILATVLGAAIGHFVFGSTLNVEAILSDASSGKGMACH